MMKYALHFGPEALYIEMEGSFTFRDTRLFHRMLSAINNNDDGRSVIHLNIRELYALDRTGLSLLMMAHDMAKKAHRPLVFDKPQGQVYDLLREAARYNSLHIAA